MAAVAYPRFQTKAPELEGRRVHGESLAASLEALDAVATRAGIKPLGDFLTAEPEDYAKAMESEPELPKGIGGEHPPGEEWFSAERGLETVAYLIGYVRDNPRNLDDHEIVIKDLLDFERLLSKAAELGIRWHLQVDE